MFSPGDPIWGSTVRTDSESTFLGVNLCDFTTVMQIAERNIHDNEKEGQQRSNYVIDGL